MRSNSEMAEGTVLISVISSLRGQIWQVQNVGSNDDFPAGGKRNEHLKHRQVEADGSRKQHAFQLFRSENLFCPRMKDDRERCSKATPFGRPVDPEVNST